MGNRKNTDEANISRQNDERVVIHPWHLLTRMEESQEIKLEQRRISKSIHGNRQKLKKQDRIKKRNLKRFI